MLHLLNGQQMEAVKCKRYDSNHLEKRKRKRRHSSSSSSSEWNEDSSGSSDYRHSKKKKKHSHKETKLKKHSHKKKHSHHDSINSIKKKKKRKSSVATNSVEVVDSASGASSAPPPVVPRSSCPSKPRGPMTREDYEKQQSVVKRVFDSDTGRHRLVKGDGEIIEEIVSKDRHKAINKLATLGDGLSFQSRLRKLQ